MQMRKCVCCISFHFKFKFRKKFIPVECFIKKPPPTYHLHCQKLAHWPRPIGKN